MFSGIIEHLVKPSKIKKEDPGLSLTFLIPHKWKIIQGESISIDGICMTAEKISKKHFSVFAMEETLRKTHLLKVANNHAYNLEKCLTLNSLLGGHLVSGHIDSSGIVSKVIDKNGSKILSIQIPRKFTKYIVYKGSITVNGVSLTVVDVSKNIFVVSLIPYTILHTNLGTITENDVVNIEVDIIAKYLEKLISAYIPSRQGK